MAQKDLPTAAPPGQATTHTVTYRTHQPGDIGWVIWRHGTLYAAEYGFGPKFESMVARIMSDFIENYDPEMERLWLAERDDGEILGSVSIVKDAKLKDTARIRVLLVDPKARGLGIGKRLIQMCVDFAREKGYVQIVLMTQSVLTGALKLYRAAGFELLEDEDADLCWSPVPSRLQTWHLVLGDAARGDA